MTMVELMISMSIAATVMSSVFGSFLFLARSSLITASYADMDKEARGGLETFARDVRMADDVADFTATGMRLHLPFGPTGPRWVSYSYDPTTRTFYRNRGTPAERAIVNGIDVFILKRYSLRLNGVTGAPMEATNDLETKQLQIQMRAVRSGAARATATNNVISARYILRNKIVSN
jgi:hypothetical protein